MVTKNLIEGAARQPTLRPQDLAVAHKLLLLENAQESTTKAGGDPEPWKLSEVAEAVRLSIGEVHNALARLKRSKLIRVDGRRINRGNLSEFLLHGVRYVFPAVIGAQARGLPTAFAAPALRELLLSSKGDIFVWPQAGGPVRGMAWMPLYPGVPDAAAADPDLYEMLAVTDVLRGDSRIRDREAAGGLLRRRIDGVI